MQSSQDDDVYIRVTDEKDEARAVNCCQKLFNCGHLMRKYDASFITLYGLQYAAAATKFPTLMAVMAVFRTHYMMDPADSAVLGVLIMLPWSFKILYGIVSDSVPICGSRKKAWIILLTLLMTVSSSATAGIRFDNPNVFAAFMTIAMGSSAGMDVIVDAMMVM